MKLLDHIFKSVYVALLFLAFAIVLWYCLYEPYKESMVVGLPSLGILTAFCGLLLRLSSSIDANTDASDKRLALQAVEKTLATLLLFVVFLSLKFSLDLIESTNLFDDDSRPFFRTGKIIGLSIIGILILMIFMDAMRDLNKLMASRFLTWKK